MIILHKKYTLLLLFFSMPLTGCNNDAQNVATDTTTAKPVEESAIQVPLPKDTIQQNNQQQTTSTKAVSAQPLPTISSASEEDNGYTKLEWDYLIPADYRPEAILSKYMEQLAELDDSSPEAMEIYGNIQAELENAPINKSLDGKKVQIAGFIAPLENDNGKITEFLLVPYYGACIHVPPPPINQTVLVKTSEGEALKAEDMDSPFWIKGVLTAEGESTDIGAAGYSILQAETEEFDDY